MAILYFFLITHFTVANKEYNYNYNYKYNYNYNYNYIFSSLIFNNLFLSF